MWLHQYLANNIQISEHSKQFYNLYVSFKITFYSITLYILSPRLALNGSGPGTPTGLCAVPIKVGAATAEYRNSGWEF